VRPPAPVATPWVAPEATYHLGQANEDPEYLAWQPLECCDDELYSNADLVTGYIETQLDDEI